MSNLLPEPSQRKLLQGFRARFVLLGALLGIATAVVSALAIFPAYIMLYTTQPAPPPPVSKQSESDAVDVATIQLLMQQYAPLVSATSTSQAIRAAVEAKPKSVRIDHITYSSGATTGLVINALAANRDAINVYKEALQKNAYFKTVVVPVEDLVGAQGGRFKITLSGDF